MLAILETLVIKRLLAIRQPPIALQYEPPSDLVSIENSIIDKTLIQGKRIGKIGDAAAIFFAEEARPNHA